MRKFFLIGILFLGLAEFGYGAWIPAKAWLSQQLLANAWQASLKSTQLHKPWPWADTWPVLKLSHANTDTVLHVLQGDSGQSLAFGPGITSQSSLPGNSGNTIISAHRDTHFDFLQKVKFGDPLVLQDRQGNYFHYEVVSMDVVDSSKKQLQIDTPDDLLTLVTCYPFNQLSAGGSLRYVVTGIFTGVN